MKTTISTLKYLAFSLLIAFSVSCDGEDGAPGLPGPAGPAGQDGAANLIDSGWFTSGTWSGTNNNWYFDKAAPELTQDLIDNGIVLAYSRLTSNFDTRPLPSEAGNATWSFIIREANTVRFTSTSFNPSEDNQFRYVIIPPAATNGKMVSIDFKSMSYEEVIAHFNLAY